MQMFLMRHMKADNALISEVFLNSQAKHTILYQYILLVQLLRGKDSELFFVLWIIVVLCSFK